MTPCRKQLLKLCTTTRLKDKMCHLVEFLIQLKPPNGIITYCQFKQEICFGLLVIGIGTVKLAVKAFFTLKKITYGEYLNINSDQESILPIEQYFRFFAIKLVWCIIALLAYDT